MKTVFVFFAALAFASGLALADPDDLTAGVFIVHFDPLVEATDPINGWCAAYQDCCPIASCDQQNPTLPNLGSHVWFVLAEWWDEPKTWCLSEFGFGNYDPNLFVFGTSGACTPGEYLEISTPGWPGPLEGTAVATLVTSWSGNFVPVYYFTGYAYIDTGQIPLASDPPTGFAGFVNCPIPAEEFAAACLPAMGIGVPGIECCSEPPETAACCVCEVCTVTTEEECADIGGTWLPDIPDCDPNPCQPSPAENTSWGSIKAIYR